MDLKPHTPAEKSTNCTHGDNFRELFARFGQHVGRGHDIVSCQPTPTVAEPELHAPDLDKLFRESADDLSRYFFRRHGSSEVAQDLVQEVFLQLARKDRRVEGSARGYLFGIARHLSAAFWRRQYRQPETLCIDHAAEADAADKIPDDRLQQAREILATLPPRDREILDLRFAHGLSYAETAESLGIPVGTVRSRLHHAIGELRRRFHSDSQP